MLEGGGDGRVEIRGAFDADAEGATELGIGGEVGVVEGGLPDVPFGGALLAGDFPQLAVVDEDELDGHVVFDGGGEFGEVLAEAAIAGDGENGPFRSGGPGPHGGGKGEADRAEVAGHENVLAGAFEVAAEGVGVVADVDGDDGVVGHEAVEGVEEGGGGDSAATVIGGATGFFGAPEGPAFGDVGALVDGVDWAASGETVEEGLGGEGGVALDGRTSTACTLPRAMGSESIWIVGL